MIVTFDLQGGNIGGDTTNPTKTVKSGNSVGTFPPEPTKAGYTFKGWVAQTWGNPTPITQEYVITSNTRLYALWK